MFAKGRPSGVGVAATNLKLDKHDDEESTAKRITPIPIKEQAFSIGNWIQSACIRVLRCGPIPRHVAFIMDGNRRFARRQDLKIKQGHSSGFDTLLRALEVCLELGVTTVSAFAFSIDNFGRAQDEVADLMDLAIEKFEMMVQETDTIMQHGVRVRILGQTSLLAPDVQRACAHVMLATQNNTK
jgi:ditrans,polycis-polyprenyl diphosphate synthase